MSPELQALADRVAALESNRIPLDMDAVNKKNLQYLVSGGTLYVGYVVYSGSLAFGPEGWSVSHDGTGQWTVTHNLNLSDYVVLAVITGTTATRALAVTTGTNNFQVNIGDASNSSGEDRSFMFLLAK